MMYRVNPRNAHVEPHADAVRVGKLWVRYTLAPEMTWSKPITEKAQNAFQHWVDTEDEARALVHAIIQRHVQEAAKLIAVCCRSLKDLDSLQSTLSENELRAVGALLNVKPANLPKKKPE